MTSDQETVKETEPAEEETEEEPTAEKQEEKKSGSRLPAIILLAAVVIDDGVFLFMKLKGKKEQEKVTTSWDGYICLRPSAKSIWLT